MTRAKRLSLVAVLCLVVAVPSAAKEYYESYAEGIKAVKAKDWSTVVAKMTEAISKEPNENKRARTYGTTFIKYHPYYYRGIANYNLGKFETAIADLQRALGVGEVNNGTPESWVLRAEQRLLAAQPAPTPPPTAAPPPPTTPQVDPNLAPARQRAESAMTAAENKMAEARGARANTLARSDFNAAQQKTLDARSRSVNAATVADWNAIYTTADQASRQFGVAISKARAAATTTPPPTTRPGTTPTPAVTRPQTSTTRPAPASDALKEQVRGALNYYFSGQFDRSQREFELLVRDQDENPMIWAFLGAARYSNYITQGDSREDLRRGAADAFRRAREIKPALELADKYFSPRIRNFYESVN